MRPSLSSILKPKTFTTTRLGIFTSTDFDPAAHPSTGGRHFPRWLQTGYSDQ
jgi:hypothetical protein